MLSAMTSYGRNGDKGDYAKEKTSGIYFKVSEEDRKLIEQRMELAGIRNMSGYIRKMCIDGYFITLQIPELTECAKLLRYTSNNVNQIARRVNSGICRLMVYPSIHIFRI